MQTAYLSGGCFWCVEAIFQRVNGVIDLKSGYCNGSSKNPTYEAICTGQTGHAEVLKIDYDESVVSYESLLEVFVETHNPMTLNQQGADKGTQYRSAIFYINDSQRQVATSVIGNIKGAVTEITELDVFYPAEAYHQDYFNNNANQPYCQMVILPKINKYFK